MKQRYRLKLTINGVTGSLGFILRLFPNALTFVGYPTPGQLDFVAKATELLTVFGVGIEVAPSS